ncbi:hypothetical protein QUV98_02740 [Massilimicrobiota timonensis]|uniref:Sporulation protein YjcZ n=1 Tax=Massilimicrobiota timonensis TaxID=1776392 RepID=A0ABT7UGF8_9FIRM|nr:hypothetical protein [Massilimicrobiota timonensis]MDM8195232.1 hypothetical protein [Massilimicrobiota timonensis]
MNSCYNYGGCGCNSFMPTFGFNPFGCSGCNSFPVMTTSCGGFSCNNGCTWFAIVLVVFLLLIICGCTKIC